MRVVRGLGALLVLVVLLAGIPYALWQLGQLGPLTGNASPQDALDLLLRPDDGSLLLAALTVLGWLAWASFALAVVVEVPAHARGLPSPRVPGLGLQQRAASLLVGAVVALLVGAGAAAPATALTLDDARPAATAAATVDVDGTGSSVTSTTEQRPVGAVSAVPDDGERAAAEPDAPAPASALVVVQQGDSLWSLAETHLGDGTQWRQIAAANLGAPQPDGGALGADGQISPGWQLTVPGAGAVTQDADQGAGTARGDLEHVVERGDTLSAIAAEHLGDADRWPEVAEATEATVQPGGERLEDPDLIYPGWTVTVPGAGEPVAPGPSADAPAEASDASGAGTGTDGADPGAGPDPAVGADGGGDQVGGPSTDPGYPGAGSWGALADAGRADAAGGTDGAGTAEDTATEDTDAAGADDAGDAAADAVDVRTPAGIGGLLAAAAVGLLAARRRDAREERRPGQRLTPPEPEDSRLEEQLRAVAASSGGAHLDGALADLRRRLAASGRGLPPVRAARLTPDDLELYLVEPADLPAPWTALDDRTVWHVELAALTGDEPQRRLVEELGLDLLGGATAPVRRPVDEPLPLPGLVCLGTDDDDGLVLLDLEQLGGLAVVGEAREARTVLAAVAAELAVGRARETVEVLLVGFGAELAAAVPGGALRHVPDVDRLLVELEARRADVDRVLTDAGVGSVADARRSGRAREAWDGQVVLLGDPADVARQAERLSRVLDDLPRGGVTTVVAASHHGDDDLAALIGWQLRLEGGAEEWATLEPAGVVLRPQRLTLPDVQRLTRLQTRPAAVAGPAWGRSLSSVALVGGGGGPAQAATPPPEPEPRLPVAEDLYGGEDPVVQLLGQVRVHHARGPSPASHTARATALVAYLATAGSPRTRSQVAEALSPARRLTEQTVHALASRTRRWLGEDDGGRPYLPRAVDSGTYRVHPAVTTDWQRWQRLLGDDITRTPVAVLVAALELVDEPFAGVVERHYAWAEQQREEVLAGVVDVAHEAARRSLQAGDADLARRAARAGMRVDPAAEVLWRDLLLAEQAAGRPAVVAQLVERLRSYADDLGVDLAPETERLLDEVTAGAGTRRGRRERARAVGL
ncbi:LysM peptidoglycan-binding domain-containing protein [Aquipuribacter sp. SD81]|uniref:LysM peptidoglycan-binding domain-containing protein n=1 Tax=Aquipuribacter sp. SD81 TaxID=3127703 RepID=UPI003016911D